MKSTIGLSALLFGLASPAPAAGWEEAGPVVAQYYNEEMVTVRGWTLVYSGTQDGVEVYTFEVDGDSHPQTLSLSAAGQMKRALCSEEPLVSWMKAGMKVRADRRVHKDGSVKTEKGTSLISCQ